MVYRDTIGKTRKAGLERDAAALSSSEYHYDWCLMCEWNTQEALPSFYTEFGIQCHSYCVSFNWFWERFKDSIEWKREHQSNIDQSEISQFERSNNFKWVMNEWIVDSQMFFNGFPWRYSACREESRGDKEAKVSWWMWQKPRLRIYAHKHIGNDHTDREKGCADDESDGRSFTSSGFLLIYKLSSCGHSFNSDNMKDVSIRWLVWGGHTINQIAW